MQTHLRGPLLHVVSDQGAGEPVILIHGVASSSVTFQNVLPLIEPSRRCITIDLLGFGQSPMPPDAEYTLAEHSAAVERTIHTLRIPGTYTLVGHSMGALIAARIGAHSPKKINKLVLVSPPIYLSPNELSNTIDRGMMDFYLQAYHYVRMNKQFTLNHAKAVERLMSIPKAMDINERTWDPFVKPPPEHAIESQTTISDLAAVTAPIEIVYGDLDEFHSGGVLKIVSRITGVTVQRVRGSDHLIGKRLARVTASAILE